MEVIVKIEKANTMTNTRRKTKTKTDKDKNGLKYLGPPLEITHHLHSGICSAN